jgi:hypothetical protein
LGIISKYAYQFFVLQVGVVSDYDLLALDQLGLVKNDKELFPQADQTWQVGLQQSPSKGRPNSKRALQQLFLC